jgi:hypothetical protein
MPVRRLPTKQESSQMTMTICHQLAVLATMRTNNQLDKWRKFRRGLKPFKVKLTLTARDGAAIKTCIEV